nr:hypothetical protein CFP56_43921 [Quercus suber]
MTKTKRGLGLDGRGSLSVKRNICGSEKWRCRSISLFLFLCFPDLGTIITFVQWHAGDFYTSLPHASNSRTVAAHIENTPPHETPELFRSLHGIVLHDFRPEERSQAALPFRYGIEHRYANHGHPDRDRGRKRPGCGVRWRGRRRRRRSVRVRVRRSGRHNGTFSRAQGRGRGAACARAGRDASGRYHGRRCGGAVTAAFPKKKTSFVTCKRRREGERRGDSRFRGVAVARFRLLRAKGLRVRGAVGVALADVRATFAQAVPIVGGAGGEEGVLGHEAVFDDSALEETGVSSWRREDFGSPGRRGKGFLYRSMEVPQPDTVAVEEAPAAPRLVVCAAARLRVASRVRVKEYSCFDGSCETIMLVLYENDFGE